MWQIFGLISCHYFATFFATFLPLYVLKTRSNVANLERSNICHFFATLLATILPLLERFEASNVAKYRCNCRILLFATFLPLLNMTDPLNTTLIHAV